jgi:hypothetical protein
MGLSADDVRGHLRLLPSPRIRLTDIDARDACRRAAEGWDICFLDPHVAFTWDVHERDAVIRDGCGSPAATGSCGISIT